MGDSDANGYDYLGSLIYSRSGSVRTLESAAFGEGRFVNINNIIIPYYVLFRADNNNAKYVMNNQISSMRLTLNKE